MIKVAFLMLLLLLLASCATTTFGFGGFPQPTRFTGKDVDSSEFSPATLTLSQALAEIRPLIERRQAQPDPSPPAIVPYFSSPLFLSMTHTLKSGQVLSMAFPGSILYSSTSGSDVQLTEAKPYGPPGIQSIGYETLTNPRGSFSLIQGVCRVLNTDPFEPWFDWMVLSTYEGTQPCLSTPGAPICEIWSLSAPDRGLVLTVYVANQVPYQYIISQQQRYVNSIYNYTYTAPTILYTPPEPSSFNEPPTCTRSYAPPCPYSPLRPVLPMIRFHMLNDTGLANQNTGDLLGDTGFLCITLLGNATGEFQQLSWYDVQINYTFGGYSYCNFGKCLGGDPFLVGREAFDGLGLPGAGQCTPNPYGSWFSLPAKGECQSGQTIESGECTWLSLGIRKTISLDCLLQRGIYSACAKNPVSPFPNAVQLIQIALSSQDPSQGGCPDLS